MCGSVILMEVEGNAAKFYGQPMKTQMQNALFSLANHSLVSMINFPHLKYRCTISLVSKPHLSLSYFDNQCIFFFSLYFMGN